LGRVRCLDQGRNGETIGCFLNGAVEKVFSDGDEGKGDLTLTTLGRSDLLLFGGYDQEKHLRKRGGGVVSSNTL